MSNSSQMQILVDEYLEKFKEKIRLNRNLLTEDNIELIYRLCRAETLNLYLDERKIGNKEDKKAFQDQLELRMEKFYIDWKDEILKAIAKVKENLREAQDAAEEQERLFQVALENKRAAEAKQKELEREIEKFREDQERQNQRDYSLKMAKQECERRMNEDYENKKIRDRNFRM
jgi:hypothetical protein